MNGNIFASHSRETITVNNAYGGTAPAPKPETRFACPDEDFGTIPAADPNALPPVPADPTMSNSNTGEIVTPKPGTKYAAPDDEYGAAPSIPSYLDNHGCLIETASDATVSNTVREGEVVAPKPGTKFA